MQTKYVEVGGTVLKWMGEWALDADYETDHWVRHNNDSYLCTAPHTAVAAYEPGVGADWEDVWELGPPGVVGIAAGTITLHDAYANGHSYVMDDLVMEAKSGYGTSLWMCYLAHTGATNKNPTGSSGATYWKEVAAGGQNGESSTTTALDSFTTVTTTPTPATDLKVAKIGGTWRTISFDTAAKRYASIDFPAEALYPTVTYPAGTPSLYETPTHDQCAYSSAFIHTGSNDGQTYLCKRFTMPAIWDGGPLKAYIKWYSTGTTSSGVCWGVRALSVADNEAMDAASGTAVEVIDSATGVQYKELKTGVIDNIVPSGTPAGGETLYLKVYRRPAHASDVLNETVYLLELTLVYGIDKHSEA